MLHHWPRNPLGVLQYTELWWWATPRSAFRTARIHFLPCYYSSCIFQRHTHTQWVCYYWNIIYRMQMYLQTSQLLLQLRTVTQEMAAHTVESCQRPSVGRSASSGALWHLINIQRHHRHTPMRKAKDAIKWIELKSLEPLNIQRNLWERTIFSILLEKIAPHEFFTLLKVVI